MRSRRVLVVSARTRTTAGRVQIIVRTAQFLAAQPTVISKREHQPIADPLSPATCKIALHCGSEGIHGNFVKRGTKPCRWPLEPCPGE